MKSKQEEIEATRAEFLSRCTYIGSLALHPVSLGTLWILEKLDHPFVVGSKPGQEKISIRDTVRAIFAVTEPGRAGDLMSQKGIDAFDAEAMRNAIGIPPSLILEVNEWLVKEFTALAGEPLPKAETPAPLPIS